jgi:hypothetical protein
MGSIIVWCSILSVVIIVIIVGIVGIVGIVVIVVIVGIVIIALGKIVISVTSTIVIYGINTSK